MSESLRVKAPLVLILVGGVEAIMDEAGWMLGSYIGLLGGYITLEAAIAARREYRCVDLVTCKDESVGLVLMKKSRSAMPGCGQYEWYL